ncbi:MAG: response regulator [Desulfobacterales bacterium]|jgi:DNA-binding NtrC family response regulator|nr:response regulator [Desulfobacterales bacterium]
MRPSVLVVDDEPIVRRSCRLVLEDAGWQVLEAGSAGEAVALLDATVPRLLIVDYKMPGEDGMRLIGRLREMGIRTPAVLMSGYTTEETARDAERLGALAFLGKPFTPDELTGTIQQVLNRIDKEGGHGQSEDSGHR